MKTFSKVSAILFAAAFVLGVAGPLAALAATDPGLGAAGTFSVIAQTAITNVPTSVISGDVGLNSAASGYSGLTGAEVAGTIYASNISAPATAILSPTVQANLSTAYTSNIPGQGSDGSIGPVLDGLTVTPGVYDIGAGRLNGGVLHLNGPGIYIFRASSDFISSGSIDLQNGARACDVYWRVETLATINGSSFIGTILAGTGVHFGANVVLNGRALAVGGDVTMISDTITGPTCSAATSITVIKTVANDNGGTKLVADFPLFVNGASVVSGVTNNYAAGTYTISETASAGYTQSFSGDCNSAGVITLTTGAKVCIITNNDNVGSGGVTFYNPPVPPLIDVVKTANPLALPLGPGPVAYTYTLRNIGTVPVTDVTMVGDSCSPIVLQSGDLNSDNKLDVSETWVYTCSRSLTSTHTNTVVATGYANGISATDIASATVIVGLPIIPPLIHVTKVPSPLTLLAGGGLVTYTETVTNPGTVALSNITLTDDKCSPMRYVSGDANGDAKLDSTEVWTYTCSTNLNQTTLNTATATGQANGLTATDYAIATVVVAAATPALPNTGAYSSGVNSWGMAILAVLFILAAAILITVARKKAI